MRVLIGAACVAVLAFVGYYFWKEYQSQASISALALSRSEAMEGLFDQSGVADGDTLKVEIYCKRMVAAVTEDTILKNNIEALEVVRTCREAGAI